LARWFILGEHTCLSSETSGIYTVQDTSMPWKQGGYWQVFWRWVWKTGFSTWSNSWLPMQFQAGLFILESVAYKEVTQTSFLCKLLYLLPALPCVSGNGEQNCDDSVP